jgi:hypothetical protein
MEGSRLKDLDKVQVLEYMRDLKSLLSTGTFMEQKGFLRSFIKRIDYEPGQVSINYTVPMPVGDSSETDREVLSIGVGGEPGGIRTRDALIKRYLASSGVAAQTAGGSDGCPTIIS